MPKPKRRKCKCDHCKLSAEIERVRKTGDFADAMKMVDYLSNELVQSQADENYHSAIMEGSWPSSVEILTRALANAKNFQREEPHS